MKTIQKYIRIISIMLIFTFLVACSNNNNEVMINPSPVDNNTIAYMGTFVTSAHPTSGNVTVNKEKTKLNFTNFKSDNAPNLDIYLVSNLSSVSDDYINLGDIKGLDGDYTYDLPANTDYTVYKYVVVWCVDFKVNFGYAILAP